MKVLRVLGSLAVGVALCGWSASTSQAGLFPCLWDALFGNCCGGCFFPSPCGAGACGTTYYYGPACAGGNCGVVTSAACAPCGQPALSADCVLSPVPAASGAATQSPSDPWKKRKQTYSEENGKGAAKAGSGSETDDFRSRSGSGGARQDEQDSTRTDFKPVTGDDAGGAAESTPIQPRDSNSGGSKQKAPGAKFREDDEVDADAPPTGNEKSSKTLQPRPKVDLDAKVAWRPAPPRQRLELKSASDERHLVRRPAYPKSNWVDSGDPAAVARK